MHTVGNRFCNFDGFRAKRPKGTPAIPAVCAAEQGTQALDHGAVIFSPTATGGCVAFLLPASAAKCCEKKWQLGCGFEKFVSSTLEDINHLEKNTIVTSTYHGTPEIVACGEFAVLGEFHIAEYRLKGLVGHSVRFFQFGSGKCIVLVVRNASTTPLLIPVQRGSDKTPFALRLN